MPVITMTCHVFIEPTQQGWLVRGDFSDSPRQFTSGACAEQAARELSLSLAQAGEPVVLEIRLRDGARAGRFLFPPCSGQPLEASALRG